MYRKLDPALPKIGARLALARRALDLTRFQMARLLGTDTSTWGTYEAGLQRMAKGVRLFPKQDALRKSGPSRRVPRMPAVTQRSHWRDLVDSGYPQRDGPTDARNRTTSARSNSPHSWHR